MGGTDMMPMEGWPVPTRAPTREELLGLQLGDPGVSRQHRAHLSILRGNPEYQHPKIAELQRHPAHQRPTVSPPQLPAVPQSMGGRDFDVLGLGAAEMRPGAAPHGTVMPGLPVY